MKKDLHKENLEYVRAKKEYDELEKKLLKLDSIYREKRKEIEEREKEYLTE